MSIMEVSGPPWVLFQRPAGATREPCSRHVSGEEKPNAVPQKQSGARRAKTSEASPSKSPHGHLAPTIAPSQPAHPLHPAALAFMSYGIVLVRVRVRVHNPQPTTAHSLTRLSRTGLGHPHPDLFVFKAHRPARGAVSTALRTASYQLDVVGIT